LVTGTVKFDANTKTDGSLDYQASNGMWPHGFVTPGSYQKIDAHTAVFAGEITGGSDDYTVNHDGTDYFTVKVVDGSTSGRSGDILAVLANMDGHGNPLTSADATTTRDYPMSDSTAGFVTGFAGRRPTRHGDAVRGSRTRLLWSRCRLKRIGPANGAMPIGRGGASETGEWTVIGARSRVNTGSTR